MAKVLLIDDSMFMRMQVAKILKSGGHQVAQVADPREGLTLAERVHPDCIVLDLLMPDLDGLGFLAALRERGLTTPVIVHTADIQDITREKCLALGAKAFLNKPPKRDELLAAVAVAVAGGS
jgi:twitching motility two-component system response regulator PilH